MFVRDRILCYSVNLPFPVPRIVLENLLVTVCIPIYLQNRVALITSLRQCELKPFKGSPPLLGTVPGHKSGHKS